MNPPKLKIQDVEASPYFCGYVDIGSIASVEDADSSSVLDFSQIHDNAEDQPANGVLNNRNYKEETERSRDNLILGDWRKIWALLITKNTRKLTKENYQSVRCLLAPACSQQESSSKRSFNDCENTSDMRAVLPHYVTVDRSFRKRVLEKLVPVNLRKVGAKAARFETDGLPRAIIRSVSISKHARYDLATPHVYQAMLATCFSEWDKSAGTYCVDTLPIVRARDWFYGVPHSIWTNDSELGVESNAEAEICDTVKVQFIARRPANENFVRQFYSCPHENACDTVTGTMIGFWTVFHSSQPRRGPRQIYSGKTRTWMHEILI